MFQRSRKPVLILIVLLSVLGLWGVRQLRAAPDAAAALQSAWANTESVGAYTFQTTLVETTLPALRLTTVGQTARVRTTFVEGESNPQAGTLALSLWDQPDTVFQEEQKIEIEIDGLEARARTHQSAEWQPIDGFSGQFAPAGDAGAFLTAARYVEYLGNDSKAIPTLEGDMAALTYDRYTFVLDGDAYADFTREQLETQLRERGELPNGLSLSTGEQYRQMATTGEAWLTPDGLPLRLQLKMEFPQEDNGERVRHEITTTFLSFEEKPPQSVSGILNQPLDWAGGQLNTFALNVDWQQTAVSTTLLLLVLGFVALLLQQKSKRRYQILACVICFQFVFAPILSMIVDTQALDRLHARFPSLAESANALEQSELHGLPQPAEPEFNIYQSPLEAGQRDNALRGNGNQAFTTNAAPDALLNSDLDTDEDGLSDVREAVFGTNPNNPDTDGDGMDDGAEVDFCPDQEQWGLPRGANDTNWKDPFCPDPLLPDTDHDGLNDAEEALYIGTFAQTKDSDSDGITDHAEVQGFLFNGVRMYTDPLNIDSDNDGQFDGDECPAMRRTAIVTDHPTDYDKTGNNSPWSSEITCPDTDGDGTPDVFDFDDDGDGVPSHLDFAPTQVYGKNDPFSANNPFTLTLQNTNADMPLLIDVQLRPDTPEQLTYARNVLDWPSGDTEGQIQRQVDGTFGSVAVAAGQSAGDSAFNGDMRLSPMLHVTLPGDTTALPRVMASRAVSLTAAGRVMASVQLKTAATGMTINIPDIAGPSAQTATLAILRGSCAQQSNTEYVGVVDDNFSQSLPNKALGDFANGNHVAVLNFDGRTFCEPIPSLVEGQSSIEVNLVDPGVEPLGTIVVDTDGTQVFGQATFTMAIAGSYDAEIVTGSCYEPGVVLAPFYDVQTGNANAIRTAVPDLIPQKAVDVLNGNHVVRLKQEGTTISCTPLGNVVNGSLPTMIDPDFLEPLQISVSDEPNGEITMVAPLLQTVDPVTGASEAFNARLAFRRDSAGAPLDMEMNVVWLVTMLTDFCPDNDCDHPAAALNQTQVVHQYRNEAWYLTGLNVTEEESLEMAVIFEDPATDKWTNPTDPTEIQSTLEFDDYLWHMSRGLRDHFVTGLDIDENDVRDLTIADMETRWDGSGTLTDTWGIPANRITVITDSLASSLELGAFNANVIPTILTGNFGTGTFPFTSTMGLPEIQVNPTLLFATESKMRYASMESAVHAEMAPDGQNLTVDFAPPASPDAHLVPLTYASISWKPFQYDMSEARWDSMSPYDYWDQMSSLLPYAADFAAATSEAGTAEAYDDKAELLVAQIAYLELYVGISGFVENDSVSVWEAGPETLLMDDELRQLALDINNNGAVIGAHIGDAAKVIIKKTGFLIKTGLGKYLGSLGTQKIVGPLNNRLMDSKAWVNKKDIGLSVVALASIGNSISKIINGESSTTRNTDVAIAGILAAKAVYDGVKIGIDVFKKGGSLIGAGKNILEAKAKISASVLRVGVAITVAVGLGLFLLQWGMSGTSFGSLTFNRLAVQAAASIYVGLLLAALFTTGPYGALAAAVIGIIDVIIALACGLRPPDKDEVALQWVCKGISGIMAEAVAYLIYDTTDIVNINNPDRLQFVNFNPYLLNPEHGFAAGEQLALRIVVANTIETESVDSLLSATYGYQFNDANSIETSLRYAIVQNKVTDEDLQIHNKPSPLELDAHPGQWTETGDDSDIFKLDLRTVELTDGSIILPAAGINQKVTAYLAEGYAAPVQECVVVPVLTGIPICTVRSRTASNYADLGLIYDVFPATLNEFYARVELEDGWALSWGQTEELSFPALRDADGDGLSYNVDPNDKTPDADGDSVTDLRELQIGTSPINSDTDGDGVDDDMELHRGTNPLRADSDGDGLNDFDEAAGWDIGYNIVAGIVLTTTVFGDPISADADADGLFDRRERALGFSPHAASNPELLEYTTRLEESGTPDLFLRFDEAASADTFVDSSNLLSNLTGSCAAATSCPQPGHAGKLDNAAYFDGTDGLSLGYVPGINDLANNFTLAAWVYPTSSSGVNRIISISRANGNDGFGFGTRDGNLRFTAYGRLDFDSIVAVPVNEWTHVGVVVSANGGQTTVEFYRDGASVQSITENITGVIPATDQADGLMIGTATELDASTLSEGWVGRLDDVMVFDEPLSDNRMSEIAFARYNLEDGIVEPSQSLQYTTEASNKLLVRSIEGVLDTQPPDFLDGALPPRNFILPPLGILPPEAQNLTFNSTPGSGQYEMTQALGGIIDVPLKSAPGQTAAFERPQLDTFYGFDRIHHKEVIGPNLNSGDFTLAFWVRADQNNDKRGILGYGSGQKNAYPSVQLEGTDLIFGFGDGNSWVEHTFANAVPTLFDWYHFTLVFNSATGSAPLYRNGQPFGTPGAFGSSRPDAASNRFDIGRSSQYSRFKFTKFDLTCEADGAGDGRYNITYRKVPTQTNTSTGYELYWSVEGTEGGPDDPWTIPENWIYFDGQVDVKICEKDPNDDPYDRCDDSNDEIMQLAAGLDSFSMSSWQTDSAPTDVVFSTAPDDPDVDSCDFGLGADDTAKVSWEYESESLPFDGQIKGLQIYKTALTPTDVGNLLASNILFARLRLDERPAATTFADEIGAANGTCNGGSCPTSGVTGRNNTAVYFDGVDDVVVVDNLSQLIKTYGDGLGPFDQGKFHFSAWVRLDVLPTGKSSVMNLTDDQDEILFDMGVLPDGGGTSAQLYLDFKNTSAPGGVASYNPPTYLLEPYNWYYISLTWIKDDSGNGEHSLYLGSGEATQNYSMDFWPTANGKFRLGSGEYNAFSGWIDDVAVIKGGQLGPGGDEFTPGDIAAEAPVSVWHMEADNRFLKLQNKSATGGYNGCPCEYFIGLDGYRLGDLPAGSVSLTDWAPISLPDGPSRLTIFAASGISAGDQVFTTLIPASGPLPSPLTFIHSGETITLGVSIVDRAATEAAGQPWTEQTPAIIGGQIYNGNLFEPTGQPIEALSTGAMGSEFTLLAWIKPRDMKSNTDTTDRPIIGTAGHSTESSYYDFWFGLRDGQLLASFGYYTTTTTVDVPPDQWTQVGLRVQQDPQNSSYYYRTIYINGSAIKSERLFSQTINGNIPLWIGEAQDLITDPDWPEPRNYDTSAFSGGIDELAIYNVALDDKQIVDTYNYQAAWIDEVQTDPFVVDVDPPLFAEMTVDAYVPNIAQTLLITSTDDHSSVTAVYVYYGDRPEFATDCEDSNGGKAFCYLFEPPFEGLVTLDYRPIDAVGNWTSFSTDVLVDGSPPYVAILPPLPATPFAPQPVPGEAARYVVELSGAFTDPSLPGGYAGSGVAEIKIQLTDQNGIPQGDPTEQFATIDNNTYTWSHPFLLAGDNPTGVYTLTLTARDAVGNINQIETTFALDATDPLASIDQFNPAPGRAVAAADPLFLNGASLLSGSVTDAPATAETQADNAGIAGVELAFEQRFAHGSPFVNGTLPDSTLLYLPLDENNTSESDLNNSFTDIIDGAVATCNVGVDCPVNAIGTPHGQGVYFDGTTKLDLGLLPTVGNLVNDFSVGAWVKLDESGGGTIFGSAVQNSPDGWSLAADNNTIFFLKYGVGFGGIGLTTAAPLQSGVWYHVAASVAANNDITFFVNGEAVETIVSPLALANTNDPFYVGDAETSANPFAGVIDELFVLGSAAGEAEITALMGSGPTVHIGFDERTVAAGDYLPDSSGMGAEAVVENAYVPDPGIVGAYALDANINVITITTEAGALPDDNRPWTVSFWLRDLDPGLSRLQLLDAMGDWLMESLLAANSGNSLLSHVIPGGITIDSTPLPPSTLTGWHHYAFVWDGATLTTWQDGEELSTGSPGGAIVTAPMAALQLYSEHPIDDLRFYKRALPPLELAALAQTNWQAAALSSRAVGATEATWNGTVPDGLEGFYALRARGSDLGGNVDEEPRAVWSGLVDTIAPRVSLTVVGTTYTFTATDFALDMGTFSEPAACGGTGSDVVTPNSESWVRSLDNQTAAAIELTYRYKRTCQAAAALSGYEQFVICDVAGNCAGLTADNNPAPAGPVLSDLATTSMLPSSGVTVSGKIGIVGQRLGPLTIGVDWGDGSPEATYPYLAEATTLAESHQYPLPPDCSVSIPDYNVTVTLTDTARALSVTGTTTAVSSLVGPPVAADNEYTTAEDTPRSGNIITDDTGDGIDNQGCATTPSLHSHTAPASGTLNLNVDGSYVYTPALNYNGLVTFTYTVSESGKLSDSATVTMTMTAVNDAPTAVADSYDMAANTILLTLASANLQAYWPFDGTFVDASGNGSDGTAQGGVVFTSDVPAGLGGQSLLLDGSDDWVTMANPVDFAQGDYTVATWFKTSATGPRTILAGNNPGGDLGHAVLLEINPDGTLRYLHRAPAGVSGGININSPNGVADGAWHHVAAVKNGAALRLYLDGVEVGSASGAISVNHALKITIGRLDGQQAIRYFDGQIDDVGLYDQALPPTVVMALANDGPDAVLVNDADVENDPLTAVLQSPPSIGDLDLYPDGSFVYTPTLDYYGPVTFTYKADDSVDLSDSTLVTINVCSSAITIPNKNDSGQGSLRYALDYVCPGGGLIQFDNSVSGETIVLGSELDITKDVVIRTAVPITVSGNNSVRVFDVQTATVTFDGLTIANGVAGADPCPFGASCGGGIWIRSGSAVTVTNSTLRDNVAAFLGGGIFNEGSSVLVITNSTFNNNQAQFGGGLNSHGTATLRNSTFTDNMASSSGGGIQIFTGTANLGNSIIANNSASTNGPDCFGSFVSQDYNLIKDSSDCTLTGSTGNNIIGQDPQLGALADNGGPTWTYRPLPGSPVIDAGNCSGGTDQRGVARPLGAACDIGSVEVVVAPALSISIQSPADGQLDWVNPGVGCQTDLYEGTTPFFTAGSALQNNAVSPYSLVAKLGSISPNYYYLLQLTCVGNLAESNRVGEFDFGIVPGN